MKKEINQLLRILNRPVSQKCRFFRTAAITEHEETVNTLTQKIELGIRNKMSDSRWKLDKRIDYIYYYAKFFQTLLRTKRGKGTPNEKQLFRDSFFHLKRVIEDELEKARLDLRVILLNFIVEIEIANNEYGNLN